MSRNTQPATSDAATVLRSLRLPQSWSWMELAAIVDPARPICYGILMPKDNVDDGVLYVKVRDFKGDQIDLESLHRTTSAIAAKYRRSALKPEDVLVSIRGTFGRVAIVPKELDGGNITQDTARVAVLRDFDFRYVAYWLRAPDCQKYFKTVARGVAVRGVNIGDLKPCPVPIAPLAEQRRIVGRIEELFSDLEAGVAALTRAWGNLKRYRASVLKAAVEGALTAEWRTRHPQVEPASKLLQRLLTERRRQWEADQLAKFAAAGKPPPNNWQAKYAEPAPPDTTILPTLPDGWCWATIDQATNIIDYRGRTPPYADEGIPHLRSFNVKKGRLVWEGLTFVTKQTYDAFMTRGLPQSGDVLFTTEAPLGEVALVPDQPFSLAQRLMILQPARAVLDSKFLMYQIMAFEFQGRIGLRQTGSTVAGVSSRNFRPTPLRIPPLAEQQQIVATVSEKLSQIESAEIAIEHSLRRAARLRQSILKQAFEGKLVPQDPTDEPASSLLEQLRSHRSPPNATGKKRISRAGVARGKK